MGFGKLDSNIFSSSLMNECVETRFVFLMFIAGKDETGFVSGSRKSLARIFNVTLEQFDNAIKILSSPDPESRTEEHEGRRIEKIEGGYVILNHEKYRAREQVKTEKRREYMKEYMQNKRKNINSVSSANVNKINSELTPVNSGLTSVSVSVSESVSESVSDNKKKKKEKIFTPPTKAEFVEYCKKNGFYGISDRAFRYYTEGDWHDSRGKKIRRWKQKLQGVWFKDENKDHLQRSMRECPQNDDSTPRL